MRPRRRNRFILRIRLCGNSMGANEASAVAMPASCSIDLRLHERGCQARHKDTNEMESLNTHCGRRSMIRDGQLCVKLLRTATLVVGLVCGTSATNIAAASTASQVTI